MSFELAGHQLDKITILPFSLSCACASADFLRPAVALWTESACRVEWLCRPRVTLARLAGLYGVLATSRGPGTQYVLSIPYELLGDKGVASAELMVRL